MPWEVIGSCSSFSPTFTLPHLNWVLSSSHTFCQVQASRAVSGREQFQERSLEAWRNLLVSQVPDLFILNKEILKKSITFLLLYWNQIMLLSLKYIFQIKLDDVQYRTNFYLFIFLALSSDNLIAHSWSHECLSITCPGFDVLRGLLTRQSHLPHVYEALAALLLGKKASHITKGKVGNFNFFLNVVIWHLHYSCHNAPIYNILQMHLDDILQSLIDDQVDSPAQPLCVEAASIMMELVKVIVTEVGKTKRSKKTHQ